MIFARGKLGRARPAVQITKPAVQITHHHAEAYRTGMLSNQHLLERPLQATMLRSMVVHNRPVSMAPPVGCMAEGHGRRIQLSFSPPTPRYV